MTARPFMAVSIFMCCAMTETVLQTKHPRPVFVDNGDSHARQMDDIYRLQRHIYDLTRKYYLLGRDNLLDTLNPPDGGSVLEIGCGTGRNLILAARKYPKSRFYGVDISDEMLTTARTSIEKAGLSSQISVVQGNATRFQTDQPFGERTFDRIFCSYTLSMIPEWKQVIGQACSALQPDGRVHIVDFGDQSRIAGMVSGPAVQLAGAVSCVTKAGFGERLCECGCRAWFAGGKPAPV
jgi:S-adenosylmethionine-diacylgycerolhomoserine-N-methlytransferase